MTWSGRRVTKARAAIRAAGQVQPCTRCGRPVDLDRESWHADHLTERTYGGGHDPANLGPAHKKCNEAAGGRIGGRRTATRRRAVAERASGTRRW